MKCHWRGKQLDAAECNLVDSEHWAGNVGSFLGVATSNLASEGSDKGVGGTSYLIWMQRLLSSAGSGTD